jgi:hypothetical protein
MQFSFIFVDFFQFCMQSWGLYVLPCGCLSSVEVALEAAEVAVDLSGIKIDTCGCLCFVEVGAEATGVVAGWLGCEIVTCSGLPISEVGSEATGVVAGWLGCEIVTRVVSPFQRLVQRPHELLLVGWVVRLLPAAVCLL